MELGTLPSTGMAGLGEKTGKEWGATSSVTPLSPLLSPPPVSLHGAHIFRKKWKDVVAAIGAHHEVSRCRTGPCSGVPSIRCPLDSAKCAGGGQGASQEIPEQEPLDHGILAKRAEISAARTAMGTAL